MEEMPEEYIIMLKIMVFHKKIVKTTLLKILIISPVRPFKSVLIALILKDKNQEIKVTVGQLQNTLCGK